MTATRTFPSNVHVPFSKRVEISGLKIPMEITVVDNVFWSYMQ